MLPPAPEPTPAPKAAAATEAEKAARQARRDRATKEAAALAANPAKRLDKALNGAKSSVGTPIDIIDVEKASTLLITAKTPEGGLEGASAEDLDGAAQAIFTAVYGEADYTRSRETVVVFKGGLVNPQTGKPLRDVNTGIYTMKRGEASEINWQDTDAVEYNIDWATYRDFAHPALKQ